jgi:hypothetical protein
VILISLRYCLVPGCSSDTTTYPSKNLISVVPLPFLARIAKGLSYLRMKALSLLTVCHEPQSAMTLQRGLLWTYLPPR